MRTIKSAVTAVVAAVALCVTPTVAANAYPGSAFRVGDFKSPYGNTFGSFTWLNRSVTLSGIITGNLYQTTTVTWRAYSGRDRTGSIVDVTSGNSRAQSLQVFPTTLDGSSVAGGINSVYVQVCTKTCTGVTYNRP